MKHDSIVKAAVGEVGDALDMAGSEVWAKLDDDIAAGGKAKGEAVGIGHG
jgi:hypothetical protein